MYMVNGIYGDDLLAAIRDECDFIEVCDDGGGIVFAYQRILNLLHEQCGSNVVDGKPSFVDEFGGI